MAVNKGKKAKVSTSRAKKTKSRNRTNNRTRVHTLSTREYAQRSGLSRQALAKQIARGQLGDGVWKEGRTYRIDPELADKARALSLQSAEQRPKTQGNSGGKPGKQRSLIDAQAFLAETRAEIAQLELQRLQGELLPAEAVRAERFEQGRMLRDNLMALGAQIATVSIGHDDPSELTVIVEGLIAKALEDLAQKQIEKLEGEYGAAG